jgi:hypothetical protein
VKLRHSGLESARKDPEAYRSQAGEPGGFRLSKARALHLAVYEFHRLGGDLYGASEYLRALYEKNFKQPRDLNRLDDQLAEYAAWYLGSGLLVIERKLRISVPLGPGVDLVGEVPRLDMDPSGSGYAVWLFGKKTEDAWITELRLPILQAYFAERMKASLAEVSVGVYFFESGEPVQTQFDEPTVSAAWDEASAIAAALIADPTT